MWFNFFPLVLTLTNRQKDQPSELFLDACCWSIKIWTVCEFLQGVLTGSWNLTQNMTSPKKWRWPHIKMKSISHKKWRRPHPKKKKTIHIFLSHLFLGRFALPLHHTRILINTETGLTYLRFAGFFISKPLDNIHQTCIEDIYIQY